MIASDFEVIHAGRPDIVRIATWAELEQIRETLLDTYPDQWDRLADLIRQDIMIRTDYVSDGPGFAGSLAVLFWGEPQFITILGDRGSAGIAWEIIKPEESA